MNPETKVFKVEPHFLAAYLASEASISLLEVMPESDLISELKNLIYIQHDIMTHVIEGKHYGTDNINQFISYTNEMKSEANRLLEDNI